jgi:hypothetical protein
MRRWIDRLRFLWEEDVSPREEVPSRARDEPRGVPRPLRLAARFAMTGVVATSLMGQVVGIRLIAPVDAAPSYQAQCIKGCNDAAEVCKTNCRSSFQNAQKQLGQQLSTCQTSCNSLRGKDRDNCVRSCNQSYESQFRTAQQNNTNCAPACEQQANVCRDNCKGKT